MMLMTVLNSGGIGVLGVAWFALAVLYRVLVKRIDKTNETLAYMQGRIDKIDTREKTLHDEQRNRFGETYGLKAQRREDLLPYRYPRNAGKDGTIAP